MGTYTAVQLWLVNSMLILGCLLFILGLWILITPRMFMQAGQSLSRWVTTDEYFDYLDKPHFQEKYVYKYHRIAGGLIFLGGLYTLIMLIVNVGAEGMATALPALINGYWSQWLYGTLYYLLLVLNFLAMITGLVVLARPSLLKGVEKTVNRWIGSGQNLKKLDQTREISMEVLPGNPRLFGLAVTLGGIYIMLSMGVLLL